MQHYYTTFDAVATRPQLAALYQPQSMLTFEGTKLQARRRETGRVRESAAGHERGAACDAARGGGRGKGAQRTARGLSRRRRARKRTRPPRSPPPPRGRRCNTPRGIAALRPAAAAAPALSHMLPALTTAAAACDACSLARSLSLQGGEAIVQKLVSLPFGACQHQARPARGRPTWFASLSHTHSRSPRSHACRM